MAQVNIVAHAGAGTAAAPPPPLSAAGRSRYRARPESELEPGTWAVDIDGKPGFAPVSQVRLRSVISHTHAVVNFINDTDSVVRTIWIDFEGNEVAYGVLEPKSQKRYRTYATHPWIIRDEATGERMMVAGRMVVYAAADHQDVRISPRPLLAWSRATHKLYPPAFKAAAKAVLLGHYRQWTAAAAAAAPAAADDDDLASAVAFGSAIDEDDVVDYDDESMHDCDEAPDVLPLLRLCSGGGGDDTACDHDQTAAAAPSADAVYARCSHVDSAALHRSVASHVSRGAMLPQQPRTAVAADPPRFCSIAGGSAGHDGATFDDGMFGRLSKWLQQIGSAAMAAPLFDDFDGDGDALMTNAANSSSSSGAPAAATPAAASTFTAAAATAVTNQQTSFLSPAAAGCRKRRASAPSSSPRKPVFAADALDLFGVSSLAAKCGILSSSPLTATLAVEPATVNGSCCVVKATAAAAKDPTTTIEMPICRLPLDIVLDIVRMMAPTDVRQDNLSFSDPEGYPDILPALLPAAPDQLNAMAQNAQQVLQQAAANGAPLAAGTAAALFDAVNGGDGFI